MKKHFKKILFSIICFLLLPFLIVSINRVTGSANERPETEVIPTTCYASLHIDCLGERVKRSHISELDVTVAVRNDEKNSGKNLNVRFYVTDARSVTAKIEVASYNNEENAYWGPNDSSLAPGVYKEEVLNFYYGYGSERFAQYVNPASVDAYGERAHILYFKVNLLDDRFDYTDQRLGIPQGRIAVNVTTGYDLDVEEWGGAIDTVCYAADGDYIAFSAVSVDDAKRILYGDFGYFWKVTFPNALNDLFDGCD